MITFANHLYFHYVMLRTLPRRMSTSTFNIADQLKSIHERIQVASAKRPPHLQYYTPRLVAVSKTKGTNLIIEAYEAGQRHFGENYVMELHDKAHDIEIQDRCQDIQWHFIGHLQKNKVSKLLDVPNLFVVETVDSEKLAKSLNDSWIKLKKTEKLQVMVQVNTSGEANKSGCSPKDTLKLVRFIKEQCPYIKLIGLMTIGSFDHDPNSGPNPDFKALYDVRTEVCDGLKILEKELELSMGMSADYEQAIEMGSTNVRIGSTLFGERGQHGKSFSSGDAVQQDVKSSINKVEGLTLST